MHKCRYIPVSISITNITLIKNNDRTNSSLTMTKHTSGLVTAHFLE